MRKSTKSSLLELHKNMIAAGLTEDSVEVFEKSMEEDDNIAIAHELEKMIDKKINHFADWMAGKKFEPYHGNWRLITPHWVDESGTPMSFNDIYKLYISENEPK